MSFTRAETARIAAVARPHASLLSTLLSFAALYRQRRALAALDDSRLRDIGVSRMEAETEANRPIWDAPSNWRI